MARWAISSVSVFLAERWARFAGFLYCLSVRRPSLGATFLGGFFVRWIALIASRLLSSDLLPVSLVVGKVVVCFSLFPTGVRRCFLGRVSRILAEYLANLFSQ